MGQDYETRVGDVFVLLQNDALVSCNRPGFASELLTVNSWVTSEGESIENTQTYGT